jgi:hypothetical protein
MVTINKNGSTVRFEVQGLHKLWAFTNHITLSTDNIVSVRQETARFNAWNGLRLLGTSIPFIFKAGTYRKNGKTSFWDVFRKQNCIVVELQNTNYDELVIEVENPEAAVKLLQK